MGLWNVRKFLLVWIVAASPLALLCAAESTLLATQQQLDLLRFSLVLPASWSSQFEGERWLLHPAGRANELGIAPVGTGLQIDATLTRVDAHRQLWATALGSRRVVQANPTQQDKDDLGRTWTIDSALIEEAGVAYLLVLSVVELNRRAEGFLVLGTPQAIERHQPDIDAILNSVRPRTVEIATAQVRDKVPVLGRPSPLGTPAPGRFAGVWTATSFELKYGVGGVVNRDVTLELILFADGAALWGMPSEGLLGFDRAAHRARWPERWGNYVLRNKRLAITRDGQERE